MKSDEIREKIVATFNEFKPSLDRYYDYAQRAAALSELYHAERLTEVFGVAATEETLVATLDARETPKSLDTFLANSRFDKPVKRIIFDRVACKYYLYI